MAPPTRRPKDPMAAAEAMFRRGPEPAPVAERGKPNAVPNARETVTLKLDSDVLAYFQEDGPGWQDRINAALRAAASLDLSDEPGTRPEDLNATNDD